MRNDIVPDIVVRRLPLYLRTLRQVQRAGVHTISSEELAQYLGSTAAQIRRDLSFLGRFGKQGHGYRVHALIRELEYALGLDRTWDVALVGYGNLGQAIAHYRGFEPNGFRIAAIFAKSPDHIGQVVNGLVVLPDSDIERVVSELGIRIGIIAVPASAAQEVADRLVSAGVRAILNYAPVVLRVPASVTVREIDPISMLQSMTYYLRDPSCDGHRSYADGDLTGAIRAEPRPEAR